MDDIDSENLQENEQLNISENQSMMAGPAMG